MSSSDSDAQGPSGLSATQPLSQVDRRALPSSPDWRRTLSKRFKESNVFEKAVDEVAKRTQADPMLMASVSHNDDLVSSIFFASVSLHAPANAAVKRNAAGKELHTLIGSLATAAEHDSDDGAPAIPAGRAQRVRRERHPIAGECVVCGERTPDLVQHYRTEEKSEQSAHTPCTIPCIHQHRHWLHRGEAAARNADRTWVIGVAIVVCYCWWISQFIRPDNKCLVRLCKTN